MILTVVIPVYNGGRCVARCLDSLAAQTFKDFEVLIVNDGSTDDSAEVVRAYAQAHPSLSIRLVNRENSGAAESRNYGIRHADTEYIGFIDQDDYVSPDYLQAYIDAMERDRADVVCGGYQRYDVEHGKATRTVSLGDDPWAKFVVVAPWAHLYKTAFLKAHGLHFLKTPLGEDVYFTLLAYAHADRVTVIPHTGYYWVDNPASVSNDRQRRVSERVDPFILLDALYSDMPENNRIEGRYLEYYFYRYIVWYLLFTVRSSPWAQVEPQYRRLMRWLTERYPDFRRNPLISLLAPKGEPFSIRLSVWGFTRLIQTHLDIPFLKLLSKP